MRDALSKNLAISLLSILGFGIVSTVTITPKAHAADGINFQCIGEKVATYTDAIASSAGSLQHVKLISPTFNLTHPEFDTMFGSFISNLSAGSSIVAFSGNAYNVNGTSTITDSYLSRFKAHNPGKKIILAEIGWHEYAACPNGPDDPLPPSSPCVDKATAKARLKTEVTKLKSDGVVLGALFFNGYGTGGGEWAQFDVSGDLGDLCGGNCSSKFGINSAAPHSGSFPYSRVSGDGMRYVLQISDGDLPTSKAVIDAAFAANVIPIIRIGDTNGVGGGFERPSNYVSYLKALDNYIATKHGSRFVYAIAGPNEPESECWWDNPTNSCFPAGYECGSVIQDEDIPIKVSGRITSSLVTYDSQGNKVTGAPVNGAVVIAYSGTYDNISNSTAGITGKRNGQIVDNPRFAPRCSVSGRKFDSGEELLECENHLSHPCKGNECAGKYSLTTFDSSHAFDNSNYLAVMCNGKLNRLFKIPVRGGDIRFDFEVSCPSKLRPFPRPSELDYIDARYAQCGGTHDQPLTTISSSSDATVRVERKDVDNSYHGTIYDEDPELSEIPPSAEVEAGDSLEIRAGLTSGFSMNAIRQLISEIIGEPPISNITVAKHGEHTVVLPDCSSFKQSNSIISTEENPDNNTMLDYSVGINMGSPFELYSLYQSLPAYVKDSPVCTNFGSDVSLRQIQFPGKDKKPEHRLSSEYFPIWHLSCLGDTSIVGTGYTMEVENDSGDSDPRSTPHVESYAGDNIWAEGDRVVYPSGYSKYNYCFYDWKGLERLLSKRTGTLSTPFQNNDLDIPDPSLPTNGPTVRAIDIPVSLCTYNSAEGVNPDEESNNEFSGGRNREHKWVASGKFATDASKDPDASQTFDGKPYGGGSWLGSVGEILRSIFGIFQANADPTGNGECLPKKFDPSPNNAHCDITSENCQATCITIDPVDQTERECTNQEVNQICGPSGSGLGCSYFVAVAGPYNTGNSTGACLGDIRTDAYIKAENFGGHPGGANLNKTLERMDYAMLVPYGPALAKLSTGGSYTFATTDAPSGEPCQGCNADNVGPNFTNQGKLRQSGATPNFDTNYSIDPPGVLSTDTGNGSSDGQLGNACQSDVPPPGPLEPPWEHPNKTSLSITGAATYYAQGVMEQVLSYRRGVGDITSCGSCVGYAALFRPGDINRKVWVNVPGHGVDGPLWVIDTGAKEHSECLATRGWAIDVDYETIARWGKSYGNKVAGVKVCSTRAACQ